MITELLFFVPAVLVGFFILGFKLGRGHAKRPIQRIELGPNVCQCEHAMSFHYKHAGSCNAKDWDGYTCRCQMYTDPYDVGAL